MDQIRLVNTFLQLTRIESPSGFETAVRDYVAQELEKLGINYQIDQAGNLFAHKPGQGEPVLLSAHLDTVSPCQDVQPQVSAGFIKGDGRNILGADNKASVAAIIEALEAVHNSETRPVELIFSVREETDGGLNEFDFSRIKSKTGLVADTELPIGSVVLAAPWITNLNITVTGKSAHSSTPEDGINALTIASKAINSLTWGLIDEFTTANMGYIDGGTGINTIPETIVLRGEVRSYKKALLTKNLQNIQDTFTKIATKLGGSATFSQKNYCAGYGFSPKSPEVITLADIYQKLGLNLQYHTSLGGSDANILNEQGIRVVNIGDGTLDIHTTRERISIDSLINLTKIFMAYLTYPYTTPTKSY